jgi:hypothetical protein
MPAARPTHEVGAVLALRSSGATDREISELTGVPVNTIRIWGNRGLPLQARRAFSGATFCARCGAEAHDHASIPDAPYAYLLGVYLGDGCVSRNGRSWRLSIAQDASYPGIVASCREAIEEIVGRAPRLQRDYGGKRCVHIVSGWKQWPCYFPQHGLGRKHSRKIALVDWQRRIVERCPEHLLRGLIHSDGWRGLSRVFVKGRWYEYPRYQFSNRSDDIRRIFTDTCDLIGVRWRPWGRYHISVARREAVAKLDEFVGPKS